MSAKKYKATVHCMSNNTTTSPWFIQTQWNIYAHIFLKAVSKRYLYVFQILTSKTKISREESSILAFCRNMPIFLNLREGFIALLMFRSFIYGIWNISGAILCLRRLMGETMSVWGWCWRGRRRGGRWSGRGEISTGRYFRKLNLIDFSP